MYRESSNSQGFDQKKSGKYHHPKQKASVNVASPQPAKQAHSPQPKRAQSPPQQSRGSTPQRRSAGGSPFIPTRYPCKLCNEHHYLYSCSQFEQLTVPQRKEHIRLNPVCHNCLKPGHATADCRSDYKCRVCNGKHNTLIHDQG